MIAFLQSIIPYISGLHTLPWIIVGFIATIILSKIYSQVKVDLTMKNIALILLFFFVPLLVFRIFLDTPFGRQESVFVLVVALTIGFMYLLAYLYGLYQVKSKQLTGTERTVFLKTIITNQGRSSAFVGGIMLAIEGWGVPAGIFMALVGIALFAVVPFILSSMNKKGSKKEGETLALPWFLRVYPWYFIIFPSAGIFLQKATGMNTADIGSLGVIVRFLAALTIPAALYYVGSGMHPNDMKLSELKKLLGIDRTDGSKHWSWVRHIFIMTTVVTPVIITAIFLILLKIETINLPPEWFAVCVINSILPITSTNMFLVPYGIDKRATAHSITWSTIITIPIVIALISLLSIYLN